MSMRSASTSQTEQGLPFTDTKKNMFSEFRGCYKNIERQCNVRKKSKPSNSTKKKKGVLESMNKFEKNLEEIQKVRIQWESQSKPIGIYKNIRKLDSTLCSLSGF